MEATHPNSKKVFFSGVLLLSLSTVLVKVIGLIYKIPMLSYLGSEGMGYFNSAYEIYALFCIIATAGLPVALSVLISGALARGETMRAERIYRVAFRIFLSIGLVGCGAMWLFAETLCNWIKSANAYACIISIAPTILFVCISSAIRGYFQGFQRMLPTAASQFIEAAGKLILGLIFASQAMRRGASTEIVAAAAGWGLSAGTALSTAYLLLIKRKQRKRMHPSEREVSMPKREEMREIFRSLGTLALPMTLGASLTSMTKLVDMTMILRGLQSIGYTEAAANETYGSYTTLALSVFSLLPTLLNSVSLPLVPILSSAIASKDTQRQQHLIETSYRLTAWVAIPASLGISLFARPILSLIFQNQESSISIAAPLLALLGVSVFLSCMITATNSVLHAHRIVKRPLLSLLLGAIVKIVIGGITIHNPMIGIMGAPISTFFCNATIVAMNFFFSAHCSAHLSVRKIFILPFINGVTSVGVSFLCYRYFSELYFKEDVLTLGAILLATILYLILSVLSGTFHLRDIHSIPGGNHLFRWIERFKENKQKTGKKFHFF